MNYIDNSINYRGAIIVGGIAIAWGAINPSSALGGIAAVISGIVGSALVYVPSKAIYDRYEQIRHRVSHPLIIYPKTEEFELKFNEAFALLQKHPHYNWLNNTIHEGKLPEFLKKTIESGICFGSTINILKNLDKDPLCSGSRLIESIDYADIIYEQLLHFMHCFLQATESSVKFRLNIAQIQNNKIDYGDIIAAISGKTRPVTIKNPPTPEILELETTLSKIQQTIISLKSESIPWEEVSNEPFKATEGIKTWKTTLETLMSSQGLQLDTPIIGRIEIRGDEKDRKQPDYTGAHAISFRCAPNQFGFYDSISKDNGGFYEFKNKTEFFQFMKKQLLDGLSTEKNPQVTFFIKKQNQLR